MQKTKVAIAGAAGYTGGELIRILLHHPFVEISAAVSKSFAGRPVYEAHTDLLGETELHFSTSTAGDEKFLFLCMGHGESKKYLETNPPPTGVRIIDLSQDFRLSEGGEWIYGLPELNRGAITEKDVHIANPGCFATCIQLGVLPLAVHGLLKNELHISAITGSTGAGQSLSATSHFSWRDNNISTYKVFTHQHEAEIRRTFLGLGSSVEICFVPYRGNFSRGIYATLYTDCALPVPDAIDLWTTYYATHPFVHISEKPIHLKQVINTNKCLIHLEKQGKRLLITSAIDNLLKGASGQAVQNMNLLAGLDESAGLNLKPSAF